MQYANAKTPKTEKKKQDKTPIPKTLAVTVRTHEEERKQPTPNNESLSNEVMLLGCPSL
jgi:hypothetical protein